MSGSHTCSTGGSAKIAGSGGSVSVFTACATRSGRRPNASSWSTLKKEQKLPAVSRNCNVYSQPRSRKNTESPHDTMPKKRNFKMRKRGTTDKSLVHASGYQQQPAKQGIEASPIREDRCGVPSHSREESRLAASLSGYPFERRPNSIFSDSGNFAISPLMWLKEAVAIDSSRKGIAVMKRFGVRIAGGNGVVVLGILAAAQIQQDDSSITSELEREFGTIEPAAPIAAISEQPWSSDTTVYRGNDSHSPSPGAVQLAAHEEPSSAPVSESPAAS